MSDEILRLAVDLDSKNQKKRNLIINSQPKQLSKKRIQELMDEKTAEGMETAIDSTNKGYQLLQRFGYTKGNGGLGKNNNGIENPLKIMKREVTNKAGLGVEEEEDQRKLKEKIENKRNNFILKIRQEEEEEENLEEEFVAGIKHKKRVQQMKYEIHSCEVAIENLDLRAEVIRHNLWAPLPDDDNETMIERENERRIEKEMKERESLNKFEKIQESYLKDLERLQLCIQVRSSPLSVSLSLSHTHSISDPHIAIVSIVEMILRAGMTCPRTVLDLSKKTTTETNHVH
jgi:hypothetical protein